MRVRTMGLTALFCAAVGAAGVAQLAAQSGFDRPGGDYASAPVANGDPAVCAARCEQDKGCRSWSFSYPSTSGEPAMCWLKREIVPRAHADCCVSGVRGGRLIEPALGQFEHAIDRAGGDYRSFEVPDDPDGKACAAACQAESRCRAWTYRRPGYGSTVPRCYLKDAIKAPHRRPCCISGVVR